MQEIQEMQQTKTFETIQKPEQTGIEEILYKVMNNDSTLRCILVPGSAVLDFRHNTDDGDCFFGKGEKALYYGLHVLFDATKLAGYGGLIYYISTKIF